MALTKYIGKSAPSTITCDGTGIPGWRKITIEERGKPIPDMIDVTDEDSTSYEYVADPLGGKGSLSATITVEGYLSATDFVGAASPVLYSADGNKIGDADTIVFWSDSGGGDQYTLTNGIRKTTDIGLPFAGVVPYTASWELAFVDTSTTKWATA